MENFLDLAGNRYGHLTALEFAGKNEQGQTMWLLQCDCGKKVTLPMSDFKYGKCKSCGCMKSSNLSGKKFNRLTVIRRDGKYKSGNIRWLCQCECGNFTHASKHSLESGEVKSCGCYIAEKTGIRNFKHGGFGTRLYEIWRQMHRRCYGKNNKAYPLYGGRGIAICDEWKEYEHFEKWALSHGYSENLTIDRIDVNGNYTPENCRWATVKEQANNRRNNRNISYKGEIHTISEWSERYGVNQQKLRDRLSRNGWDLEKALKALGAI